MDLLDIVSIEGALSLQFSCQTIRPALLCGSLGSCSLESCPQADLQLPESQDLQTSAVHVRETGPWLIWNNRLSF